MLLGILRVVAGPKNGSARSVWRETKEEMLASIVSLAAKTSAFVIMLAAAIVSTNTCEKWSGQQEALTVINNSVYFICYYLNQTSRLCLFYKHADHLIEIAFLFDCWYQTLKLWNEIIVQKTQALKSANILYVGNYAEHVPRARELFHKMAHLPEFTTS